MNEHGLKQRANYNRVEPAGTKGKQMLLEYQIQSHLINAKLKHWDGQDMQESAVPPVLYVVLCSKNHSQGRGGGNAHKREKRRNCQRNGKTRFFLF